MKEDIAYRKYILGNYGCFTIELKPNTPVREYGEKKKRRWYENKRNWDADGLI